MKNKSFFRNWLILVVTLAIVGFLGYSFYTDSLEAAVDPDAAPQAFVIQKGETLQSIADRLEQEKIIRSGFYLKKKLQEKGRDSSVQPGDYKLSGAMTLAQVAETLSQGAQDRWVTLLEGWRVEQMAASLNAGLGISKEEFIQKARQYEGRLFPDTYLINKDASVETVISVLRNNFEKKFSDDMQAKVRLKGLTPEQGVILASLVEREGRSDGVRKQVAGIILKRLKIGMKLDIDATVRYAKDSQALSQGSLPDKYWQAIAQSDYTEVKSPYNTYLNSGLPPGAICNPSLSSLNAVAEADASTPYLYYYHDSKGNSYYASTLDEHNQNVANNP